jgi:ribosomal protein S18 acetylase RimI-like enzyme
MSRRELDGGFQLDDDPARIDVELVCDFLAEEAYWAKGRDRDLIRQTFREATRVIGAYEPGGRMAGYCRVLSDTAVFAYLADVFVIEEFRGRGLGVELVREAVENGPQRELRWILGTADARGLYEKFGFGEPSYLLMERPSSDPEPWRDGEKGV